MPKSAKPKKRYRPRHRLENPIAWVLQGFKPLDCEQEYMTRLQVRVHGAMRELVAGRGTGADADRLLEACNIVHGLLYDGLGAEYDLVAKQGYDALQSLLLRAAKLKRYVFNGPEITAVNALIELHDAQMEACTVEKLERAIATVKARKPALIFNHCAPTYEQADQPHKDL